jgi:carboxymethylenebutenolidase
MLAPVGRERGGSEVEIPAEAGVLGAYRALPAAGRGRGVLVLHEAFGLDSHARDVCERLAREGFVALAPDLYRGGRAQSPEEARALAGALEPERTCGDLAAAVKALLGDHAVEGGRIGAVGFCMGGQLALLAAAQSPRVAAVVDCYGYHPGLPVDCARIRAAVLGLFGGRDELLPPERVEALRAELAAAGVRASFRVDPGAGHAFMNDARPDRYSAPAAAEGWRLLLAFLRAELA